jgi:acyl-CoA synthetase (AMP-forming)/AMP-acid ligase II
MHPSVHAQSQPDKAAVIEAETGRVISYADVDAASNRFAHLLRGHGLSHGDVIALMLDNLPEYFGIAWGAQRAGLHYVCISTRLTPAEVNYILADSGAQLLLISESGAALADQLVFSGHRYTMDVALDGWMPIEPALAAQPATPIADERAGTDMLYSSGTTGRPKGVKLPLPDDPAIAAGNVLVMVAGAFGIHADSIYLTPAPLYHAAPLRWSMTVQRLGGTIILMRHFDAEATLAAIERYRITAGQFVPTHFIRMLKLPPEVRARYDDSTMQCAIHAAAPCPVPVKQAMIDWWGPVIWEYYAGSEGNGITMITSEQWLTHQGSVGKAISGILHICDEDGNDLPPRTEGLVYFEGGNPFSYHNDPEKTAESHNQHGWSTLGDIGWMDEEGYLYLTDRKSFMIISGGVNIYPQEIENHLVGHAKVADVAVIGAPHPDMGEQVVAIVQPLDMADAGDALAAELDAYCRTALSGVKIPRRIDFRAELPRHPTGKLYKRLLRDEYWAAAKDQVQ